MAKDNFQVLTPRYSNSLFAGLFQIGFASLNLWWYMFNSFIACFYTITSERKRNNDIKYFKATLYGVLLVWCTPIGIGGLLTWIFACTFFDQKPYSFLRYKADLTSRTPSRPKIITITTSNVLLAPEIISRYNNCKDTWQRASTIGERIVDQMPHAIVNLSDQTSDAIFDKFPQSDILCLQEVWERYHAGTLVETLSSKYEYFLFDVGKFSWNTNKCMMGSGLFVASRYRILAADFHVFSYRTAFAKVVSYGVLCFSVELYRGRDQLRRVGYVANLHLQAYQETDPVLYSQLTETLCFVRRFQERTKKPADVVAFDVICGDFNFDNMSPGDVKLNKHALLNLYKDPASIRPGKDKPWSLGTELRQRNIHDKEIQEPKHFAEKLKDVSERRKYVLDADVEIQTQDLASILPEAKEDGTLPATPSGGMRRIDRLLKRGGLPHAIGYGFSSSLSGLTDHLPVSTTLNLSSMYIDCGMSEQFIFNRKVFQ